MAEPDEPTACQICGTPIEPPIVWCSSCGTPHHADCWDYLGRCSAYGCAGDVARTSPPSLHRPSEQILVIDAEPAAVTVESGAPDSHGIDIAKWRYRLVGLAVTVGRAGQILLAPPRAFIAACYDIAKTPTPRANRRLLELFIEEVFGREARVAFDGCLMSVFFSTVLVGCLAHVLDEPLLIPPLCLYVFSSIPLGPVADWLVELDPSRKGAAIAARRERLHDERRPALPPTGHGHGRKRKKRRYRRRH